LNDRSFQFENLEEKRSILTQSKKQTERHEAAYRKHVVVAAIVASVTLVGVVFWRVSLSNRSVKNVVLTGELNTTHPTQDAISLVDVTDSSNVDFIHNDGSFGTFCLPETMSGGLALFDYDGDGLEDIYFCNGANLDPTKEDALRGPGLFRNVGRLQFNDVSGWAGITDHRFGLGVTIGDYDNDGFEDILQCNFGGVVLLHNDGDGRFEVVDNSVLGKDNRFSAGATFLDVENDGDLDVFIANYVKFATSDIPAQVKLSRTIYPGPQDFPPESCQLFINQGDGTWADASEQSGISLVSGTGMGCIAGDFDADGDTDIFVANDEMPNHLFQNDGAGAFEEVALLQGVAVDANGQFSGSMGVDCGDLDNDSRADFFVTTFENETVKLFRRSGHEVFQDYTRLSRVGEGTRPHVTWGCCIADFENDGDRDLFVASGHLDRRSGDRFYFANNLLLKNDLQEQKQFQFSDITQQCGNLAEVRHCSRGAAVADLDNDGDLDVVVLNLNDRPTIFENRSMQLENNWMQLELLGSTGNRNAVGAKVRVFVGKQVYVDEVRNGRGYQSYWGARLHFGLGPGWKTARVEIEWPGGKIEVVDAVRLNQLHLFRE
jgi:enediyne biosynthesis protein E4